MSGYKPGYSEFHSPMWTLGKTHGEADNAREAEGKELLGPTPPWPENQVMYLKGYKAARG